MIILEITSEANEELFDGIPLEHQKALLSLYEKNSFQILSEPSFIKVYSFELIKMNFKLNNYQTFDISKLKNQFFNYCNKYFDINSNEIKYAYLEDMKVLIWDFLYQK